MKLLHEYKNGNYIVSIYDDGTKIRETINRDDTYFDSEFPENIDVCITKKCCINCPYCYESCTADGNHSKLFDSDRKPLFAFMNDLKPGTEFAINGNDLDHPELDMLLQFLKDKGVIANMTVNQVQFMRNIDKLKYYIDEQLIYGLGVSYTIPDKNFINELVKIGPNVVVHIIAGVHSYEDIMELAGKDLKLLVLGYKDKGRGKAYKNRVFMSGNAHIAQVPIQIVELKEHINTLLQNFYVVSFDNLAIEQLDIRNKFFKDNDEKWNLFYQGDDGSHTFYVDLVNKKYAKNSLVEEQYDIDNLSLTDMFKKIKLEYNENNQEIDF